MGWVCRWASEGSEDDLGARVGDLGGVGLDL